MMPNLNQSESNPRTFFLTACSFALFMFTMAFNLTHSAPWGDEWVEYTYSQAPIVTGELYERIVSTYQPPLYNVLMHFWLLFGSSVLWFRLFNVLVGVITGIFLFLTVRRLSGTLPACLGLCILACCYQWVFCIQECSEYALMLSFLAIALFGFVEAVTDLTRTRTILFVLGCVGAMYSQYGAAFVVVPLLLAFFVLTWLSPTASRGDRAFVTAVYLIALIFFAIPLYLLFLKPQSAHNPGSGNIVPLTVQALFVLPFTLGRIVGYFFSVDKTTEWEWLSFFSLGPAQPVFDVLCCIFGIAVLSVSIAALAVGRLSAAQKGLVVTLLAAYVFHFLAVQTQVYAMVSTGQSRGFFFRYSYFYIPLLFCTLPVLIESARRMFPILGRRPVPALLSGVGLICISISLVATLQNWNKALDDQFAHIWLENEGWEDATLLVGESQYGFEYYIAHADGFTSSPLANAIKPADAENLPDRFWLWRTNWYEAGPTFDEVVSKARAQGYTVTMFEDSGLRGQLAFLSR